MEKFHITAFDFFSYIVSGFVLFAAIYIMLYEMKYDLKYIVKYPKNRNLVIE